MQNFKFTLILLVSFITLFGCSTTNQSPVMPSDSYDEITLPLTENNDLISNRSLIGIWNVEFDLEKMTVTIEPNRIFKGRTDHTERLEVLLPGGNPNVTFAIEASFPGNCLEPYSLENFSHEQLLETAGSSAYAEVTVWDWHGDEDGVLLYCPKVTGNSYDLFHLAHDNVWEIDIVNNTGAVPGGYQAFLRAQSANSGDLYLYDRVIIDVEAVPAEPPAYNWARNWGGSETDSCDAFAVNSLDQIYCGGYFQGTADFDPLGGVYNLTSNGYEDC